MSLEWILLTLRLLAVVVIYAFLLIVILVIWRDLRAAARAQLPPGWAFTSGDQPVAQLRVASSDESALQPGTLFTLQAHTTLGRAPDNQIVLPNATVSSYHARLEQRDGEWWLIDLDSRNGTRLNDVPITRPAPLTAGDMIGIGQIELQFEIRPAELA